MRHCTTHCDGVELFFFLDIRSDYLRKLATVPTTMNNKPAFMAGKVRPSCIKYAGPHNLKTEPEEAKKLHQQCFVFDKIRLSN
jgi:hypothetical protein